MIKAAVIEDEGPAIKSLVKALLAVADDIEIIARLRSVAESVDYFSQKPAVDLIFSDVQLGDGLSFEIFAQTGPQIPVIFITGYDEFMLNAFQHNGIDYLLKPVERESLRNALNKFRKLKKHFTDRQAITKLIQYIDRTKRKRMVVKKGIENISLKLEDVVLFYTENKLVYVVDRLNKKYFADQNLYDLEKELDKNVFFRANRQYLININFVQGFKTIEKVKLLVDLTLPEVNHRIIVSQETAPQFREWMRNA